MLIRSCLGRRIDKPQERGHYCGFLGGQPSPTIFRSAVNRRLRSRSPPRRTQLVAVPVSRVPLRLATNGGECVLCRSCAGGCPWSRGWKALETFKFFDEALSSNAPNVSDSGNVRIPPKGRPLGRVSQYVLYRLLPTRTRRYLHMPVEQAMRLEPSCDTERKSQLIC